MPRELAPQDDLCAHPVTYPCFTDGQRLEDAATALRSDLKKVLRKVKFMEFAGCIWTRNNHRLQCYRNIDTPVLIEGKHFEMHLPDNHVCGGLHAVFCFASQKDDPQQAFGSLCRKDFGSRRLYIAQIRMAFLLAHVNAHSARRSSRRDD